jgi:hypothetical protein
MRQFFNKLNLLTHSVACAILLCLLGVSVLAQRNWCVHASISVIANGILVCDVRSATHLGRLDAVFALYNGTNYLGYIDRFGNFIAAGQPGVNLMHAGTQYFVARCCMWIFGIASVVYGIWLSFTISRHLFHRKAV